MRSARTSVNAPRAAMASAKKCRARPFSAASRPHEKIGRRPPCQRITLRAIRSIPIGINGSKRVCGHDSEKIFWMVNRRSIPSTVRPSRGQIGGGCGVQKVGGAQRDGTKNPYFIDVFDRSEQFVPQNPITSRAGARSRGARARAGTTACVKCPPYTLH